MVVSKNAWFISMGKSRPQKWFVVFRPIPLKNDGVRQLGLFFPTECKNKTHVPNHQPVIINHYKLLSSTIIIDH
jgi:hypothetical protein